MKPVLFATLLGTALASPTVVLDSRADDPVSTPSPKTLQSGAYWIRAVAAPNYHKYLQTLPANVPGTAVLESYTTAGQFAIEDGQLVNKVSNPPLYMWVQEPVDKANPPRTLATSFNTTKNPFGTFAWQGDALTWSVASVKRQNLAAWLVCAKQALFINTGAYSYQTPSGCSDQTVSHAYQSPELIVDSRHIQLSSPIHQLTSRCSRSITTTTRPQTTEEIAGHGNAILMRLQREGSNSTPSAKQATTQSWRTCPSASHQSVYLHT